MNCKNIKAMFSEYFDGELTAEEKNIFDQHLDTCPTCKEEFNRYRKSLEYLANWQSIEPDKHYMIRFWKELKNSESQFKSRLFSDLFLNRKLSYGLAAAAVFIAAVAGPTQNYIINKNFEKTVNQMDQEMLDMIENYELLKDYDLVEDMEYLDDV